MTKRLKYNTPETYIVPYRNPLMVISGSAGVKVIIVNEEEEFPGYAKENDFGEEEGFENDFWEDERKDFGLEEWTDEW